MPKVDSENAPKRDKGSYRHMLDFVSASNFREIMNSLLDGTDACLAQNEYRHPCGRSKKKDWTEIELEDYLTQHPIPGHNELPRQFRQWWITYGGKRPTWDLLCHVLVDEKPGLLLVEAKAHIGEITKKDSKSPADRKNDRSVANDLNIRLRLVEASLSLTKLGFGSFCLSADHDYQLSNRLAYLQKLANDGVPTILLYLGWVKSPDWPDDAFTDGPAWEQCIRCHMSRIAPRDFVGSKIQLGTGASLQMIVRSIHPDVLNSKVVK